MLETQAVTQLARRLKESRDERRQIRQLSRDFPDMTVEDAYAIQRAWLYLELSQGRTIRGYKVGLTTSAAQMALRAPGPAYGPLIDEMFFSMDESIPAERFIAPRVEVELAFVLGRPLQGTAIEVEDVLEATAYVSPAFEIIDARIEQFDRETRKPRSLIDMVSDFGAAAGVVLGQQRIRASARDLSQCVATLYVNGMARESGTGAAVQGHPARSVAWLAKQLSLVGLRLESDHVVLTGSFTKALMVQAGDTLRADYGAFGTLEIGLT